MLIKKNMSSLKKEIKTQALNSSDNPDQMDHKQGYGHSNAPLLVPQSLSVRHGFTTHYQLSISFFPGC